MTQIQSDTTGCHEFDGTDAACEQKTNRLSVAGVLISLLRKQFSSASHLLHSQFLGNKLWTSDETTTGIRIESDLRYTPEITDMKPAIIISRGNMTRDSRAIGDLVQGGNITGTDRYATFWNLEMSILVSARQTAEVELVAEEVLATLTHFQHPIRRQAGLLKFRATSVSRVSRVKNIKDRWGCKIITNSILADQWSTTPFCTDPVVFEGLSIEVLTQPWARPKRDASEIVIVELPAEHETPPPPEPEP